MDIFSQYLSLVNLGGSFSNSLLGVCITKVLVCFSWEINCPFMLG